jgi:hypothetical protein
LIITVGMIIFIKGSESKVNKEEEKIQVSRYTKGKTQKTFIPNF